MLVGPVVFVGVLFTGGKNGTMFEAWALPCGLVVLFLATARTVEGGSGSVDCTKSLLRVYCTTVADSF